MMVRKNAKVAQMSVVARWPWARKMGSSEKREVAIRAVLELNCFWVQKYKHKSSSWLMKMVKSRAGIKWGWSRGLIWNS